MRQSKFLGTLALHREDPFRNSCDRDYPHSHQVSAWTNGGEFTLPADRLTRYFSTNIPGQPRFFPQSHSDAPMSKFIRPLRSGNAYHRSQHPPVLLSLFSAAHRRAKPDPASRLLRRRHQLPNRVENHPELLVVLALHLLKTPRQIAMRTQNLPQLHKRPQNGNVHLHRAGSAIRSKASPRPVRQRHRGGIVVHPTNLR